MRRIALTMTGLLVLALASHPAFAELKSGTKAPGFRLSALTGETVTLTIRDGRLVLTSKQAGKDGQTTESKPKAALLHFCQPACQVCQKEMVQLQKLHEKYVKDGLAVLGISMSPMEFVAKQTVKRLNLTYRMLKGADTRDAEKWDTNGCPAYVIDSRGVIRLSQTGFTEGDEKKWEKTIRVLFKEAATPSKQK